MTLTKQQKAAIKGSIASPEAAELLIAKLEEMAVEAAADVADITSTNLTGVDGTGSNAAPLAGTETRLDAIESKINAVLASLRAAGLMA